LELLESRLDESSLPLRLRQITPITIPAMRAAAPAAMAAITPAPNPDEVAPGVSSLNDAEITKAS
jgi:hypothetical protein